VNKWELKMLGQRQRAAEIATKELLRQCEDTEAQLAESRRENEQLREALREIADYSADRLAECLDVREREGWLSTIHLVRAALGSSVPSEKPA
jgi:hypothetical protein